jgi:hypothetical protein
VTAPEIDPVGLVLVLEPGPAETEPGAPAGAVIDAAFAVTPGLRNVLAPTISPRLVRSVMAAHAASSVQPSNMG